MSTSLLTPPPDMDLHEPLPPSVLLSVANSAIATDSPKQKHQAQKRSKHQQAQQHPLHSKPSPPAEELTWQQQLFISSSASVSGAGNSANPKRSMEKPFQQQSVPIQHHPESLPLQQKPRSPPQTKSSQQNLTPQKSQKQPQSLASPLQSRRTRNNRNGETISGNSSNVSDSDPTPSEKQRQRPKNLTSTGNMSPSSDCEQQRRRKQGSVSSSNFTSVISQAQTKNKSSGNSGYTQLSSFPNSSEIAAESQYHGAPHRRRLSAPIPPSQEIRAFNQNHPSNSNNTSNNHVPPQTPSEKLYAGATFQNSPAATSLPIPIFSSGGSSSNSSSGGHSVSSGSGMSPRSLGGRGEILKAAMTYSIPAPPPAVTASTIPIGNSDGDLFTMDEIGSVTDKLSTASDRDSVHKFNATADEAASKRLLAMLRLTSKGNGCENANEKTNSGHSGIGSGSVLEDQCRSHQQQHTLRHQQPFQQHIPVQQPHQIQPLPSHLEPVHLQQPLHVQQHPMGYANIPSQPVVAWGLIGAGQPITASQQRSIPHPPFEQPLLQTQSSAHIHEPSHYNHSVAQFAGFDNSAHRGRLAAHPTAPIVLASPSIPLQPKSVVVASGVTFGGAGGTGAVLGELSQNLKSMLKIA